MSKGLEVLEKAKKRNGLPLNQEFAPITEKEIEIIEKELKALEIIKEKKVNVSLLFNTGNHWDYNDHVIRSQIYLNSNSKCLTQEEYNLLKEVL